MNLVVPGSIVAIAIVLTIVFRMSLESITGVPLSSAGTSLVGAFFIATGLCARWVWNRRKKKAQPDTAAGAAAGGRQA